MIDLPLQTGNAALQAFYGMEGPLEPCHPTGQRGPFTLQLSSAAARLLLPASVLNIGLAAGAQDAATNVRGYTCRPSLRVARSVPT